MSFDTPVLALPGILFKIFNLVFIGLPHQLGLSSAPDRTAFSWNPEPLATGHWCIPLLPPLEPRAHPPQHHGYGTRSARTNRPGTRVYRG